MKRIMSIAIGTLIIILAISSFKPKTIQSVTIPKASVELGEPIINTPADVNQYMQELSNGEIYIPTQQVL